MRNALSEQRQIRRKNYEKRAERTETNKENEIMRNALSEKRQIRRMKL